MANAQRARNVRPKHDPPIGMEPYDLPGVFDSLGALSDVQQEDLDRYKDLTRQADERYLRQHPEVSCMVEDFIYNILEQQPTCIEKFATDYFTDPKLGEKVSALLNDHMEHKKINFILKNSFIE